MLGVFDDRLDGLLLGRGGSGQVVVAFHCRAVVGIDRGPAVPGPGPRVTHCVVGGADPVPVDLQRCPVGGGHAVAVAPPADHVAVHRPGRYLRRTVPGDPQPQLPALAGRDAGAQQRRMRQPLFQQGHRASGQVQALGRSTALNVGEQDRAVPGPVDVAGDQVTDPVGDDAAVGAE